VPQFNGLLIAAEFADDVSTWAIRQYNESLAQLMLVTRQHVADPYHQDVVDARRELDRARRLRCEVDPEFAKQQLPQVAA